MASKASLDLTDTRNPQQTAIDSSFSSFITQYLPQFVPGQAYGGQLSAPTSTYQDQGMSFLQKYLDQQAQPGANNLLDTAANELTSTMTGSYDPSTSPFYKATRDAAAVEQQTAQNKLNQGLGTRKKFFSSEAINEGQQLQTNTTNFLNSTLTGLAEKERQNKLTAAGMAPAMSSAQNKAAMAPIAAATTFGALPQELQQQDLERQYQEFQRQQKEKALPMQAASGAYSNLGMTPVITPAKPSFDWGSFLGQVGGMAVNAGLAYATGGASLAAGAVAGMANNAGQAAASMGW